MFRCSNEALGRRCDFRWHINYEKNWIRFSKNEAKYSFIVFLDEVLDGLTFSVHLSTVTENRPISMPSYLTYRTSTGEILGGRGTSASTSRDAGLRRD